MSAATLVRQALNEGAIFEVGVRAAMRARPVLNMSTMEFVPGTTSAEVAAAAMTEARESARLAYEEAEAELDRRLAVAQRMMRDGTWRTEPRPVLTLYYVPVD